MNHKRNTFMTFNKINIGDVYAHWLFYLGDADKPPVIPTHLWHPIRLQVKAWEALLDIYKANIGDEYVIIHTTYKRARAKTENLVYVCQYNGKPLRQAVLACISHFSRVLSCAHRF